MPRDQVEALLHRLQRIVRIHTEDADGAQFLSHPDDVPGREDTRALLLTREEAELVEDVKKVLLEDLRFEHLGDGAVAPLERDVQRLVFDASYEKGLDHVPGFMAQHARAPREHVFLFPVEYLKVVEPLQVSGTEFLPVDHPSLERSEDRPLLLHMGAPTGSVLRVKDRGTSPRAMHERARTCAERVLAVLRVGMRADNVVHDDQLRFRLGGTYAMDESGGGWGWDPNRPIEVGLRAEDVQLVETQPLARLVGIPTTDLERKAVIALEWMDLARLAPDRLNATLFDFFALEAILGDRAAGTKGLKLGLRASVLAAIVVGHFQDPGTVPYLYDRVRSAAVHGSGRPEIADGDFYWFDRSVRESLNSVLTFAAERGLMRQSDVVRALDRSPERETLATRLEALNPIWTQARDKMPEPAELTSVFLGEMYRYRLALRDQTLRMTVAVEALRERRQIIEQATWDLLLEPSMPQAEFENRASSLMNEDVPEIWRLKSEVQFLLVALRGIYAMCKAVCETSDGDHRDTIASALNTFESQVPDATLLRNIHEHLDEYLFGRGRQRHLLPDATGDESTGLQGVIGLLEDGPAYFVGGRLFIISRMVAAGESLAAAVAEAEQARPAVS